jgi:L-alanine-DL-glutamate epimerase-like enolase superfamily enzyme
MSFPRRLSVHVEEWMSRSAFRIAGHQWDSYRFVVVEIGEGQYRGWGEGVPIYYLDETAERAKAQVESVALAIERGVDRPALLDLMPPGCARNAVDCALWDLEAKRARSTVWRLAGIEPAAVTTAYTIGMEDSPRAMAERAVEAAGFPILKIKVDGEGPVERVEAIRSARPDAALVVDANQSWTFPQLVEMAPRFADLGVRLIEQPLPRDRDEELRTYRSPIPLSADESCQDRADLQRITGAYQIANIKLDKAGGLTESLLLAHAARDQGLEILVSCMGGTSLSMAPAYVVARLARHVELDGHLLLRHDRLPAIGCHRGRLDLPDPALWG